MTSEVVQKIRGILGIQVPNESNVQHLFTLTRKLIEQLPTAQKPNFSLLRFYCDWTVHSKIDRSAAGAEILEKIHGTIIKNMHTQSTEQIVRELTAALSFDVAMNQMNALLQISEPSIASQTVSKDQWKSIIVHLLEIVSQCPLKIDSSQKGLKAVIGRIMAAPIKDKSVVEEVAVIKVPKKVFALTPPEETIFCLKLITTDTTSIIVPLTPAW